GLPSGQGRYPVDDLGTPLRRARRKHVERRRCLHSLLAEQDRQGFRPALDFDALGRRLHVEGRRGMKSIRLSLLLYFLVLLAVALGAISVWSYEHTRRILATNVKIQGDYLRQQC